MALGNWDTLAFNKNWKRVASEFTSQTGVRIQIYKNWLYLADQTAWSSRAGFESPTVMEIHEGVIRYKDLQVVAVRGPQNGIYAAMSGTGDESGVIFGIGCYGYDGREWVGVKDASVDFLRNQVTEWADQFYWVPRISGTFA